MIDLFLEIFLIQADFRAIGELRSILPVLFLSGISDLDLCLADRAFPLNAAFGRHIGIDYACDDALTSSLTGLRSADCVGALSKFPNRDEK